jgi:hypothetical protein
MHASEVQHAEFPEDSLIGESSRAATLHLVPPDEEVSHVIIDMLIDRAVRRQTSAIAEVGGPAAQKPVQLIAYFEP